MCDEKIIVAQTLRFHERLIQQIKNKLNPKKNVVLKKTAVYDGKKEIGNKSTTATITSSGISFQEPSLQKMQILFHTKKIIV